MKKLLIIFSLILFIAPISVSAQDACGSCISGYQTNLMRDLNTCQSACSENSQNASQAQTCSETCYSTFLSEYRGLSSGLCANTCSSQSASASSTSVACGQCVNSFTSSQLGVLNACNSNCYQNSPNPSSAQTCIEGCYASYQSFLGSLQSEQCANTCQAQGPTGVSAVCNECINDATRVSCNDVCSEEELNNLQNNQGPTNNRPTNVNSVPNDTRPVVVANPFGEITDVRGLIARVLQGAMGIVGGIFFAMFVIAGVLYLTSAGNPAMIKKSTNMMVFAVIGIVIISGAYILTSSIFRAVTTTTGSPEPSTGVTDTGSAEQGN